MSRRNTDYKSVRSWSCSRDLSKVMKLPETGSKINWWRFSINVPATYKHKGGWFPLWVDEDMAGYIDRINDFDISLAELDQDS